MAGLQLEGCSFDGSRLTENQHNSPSLSALPVCSIAWIHKVKHRSTTLAYNTYSEAIFKNNVNTLKTSYTIILHAGYNACLNILRTILSF